MFVKDVMTTDLIMTPATGTVRDAVEKMIHENVGSVLITNNEYPAGIITETDALQLAYKTNTKISNIPLTTLTGDGLIMIGPEETIKTAINRMQTENVKKLPVVSDMKVLGIITLTDIVHNHDEFLQEARRLSQTQTRRNTKNWR